MPLPERRKSRRETPWAWAACSLSSCRRASNCTCSGVCGGGMNSSLEAIRVGMGETASFWASSSHLRTHMAASSRCQTGERSSCTEAYPVCGREVSVVAVPVVVVMMVVMVGGWLEGHLRRGPAELALQPAAEQGEDGQGADVAELPPEVGDGDQAQEVAGGGGDAGPGQGGDEQQQHDAEPAAAAEHRPGAGPVDAAQPPHAPQPDR